MILNCSDILQILQFLDIYHSFSNQPNTNFFTFILSFWYLLRFVELIHFLSEQILKMKKGISNFCINLT